MAALLLSDSRLRPYLDDVRDWHGYVRFLGLPTIQDHPDTPLSDLFVAPLLSAQPVAPESPPSSWPSGQDVFSALEKRQRLVVLGDPGSGKSTIINWLAWLLAGGADSVLPPWLEDVLPIPLVARELKLDGVKQFDDLLAAFLDRPVAAHLKAHRDALVDALEEGRALILLDGLDEVPLALRESLRDAVLDGWQRYPKVRFLATSRIVGYDECALEFPLHSHPFNPLAGAGLRHRKDDTEAGVENWPVRAQLRLRDLLIPTGASQFYVMPFDDARISAFAVQWYRLRSIKPSAEQDAGAFVRALQTEANVLELARTPQLLTLMALVYRVRAHLPDGRAMLYDLITEAYLESIDRARQVGDSVVDRYPWREKRRWLARVGFEMQLLRGEQRDTAPPSHSSQRELLATRSQVLGWVREAMQHSSYPADDSFAESYLDWVARRSGLLLPRGEDLFAFVHLSFQEYFAALHLVEHLGDPDWVIAQRDQKAYLDGDERVTRNTLAAWAMDALWQETLIFAHECFAHNPRDARRLSGWLFGDGYLSFIESLQSLKRNDIAKQIRQRTAAQARGELLARLLTNPHSGLAAVDRTKGMEVVMLFLDRAEGLFNEVTIFAQTSALRRLLASDSTRGEVWSAINRSSPESLNLRGAGNINPDDLMALTRLRSLDADSIGSSGLEAVSELRLLEKLCLVNAGPGVSSLAPLAKVTGLTHLTLVGSQVTDLGPLAELQGLTYLYISFAPVSDLTPLRHLTLLTNLSIPLTHVASLEPLRHCKELRFLSIAATPVEDLSPLDELPKLTYLIISDEHRLTEKLMSKQAAGTLDVMVPDAKVEVFT